MNRAGDGGGRDIHAKGAAQIHLLHDFASVFLWVQSNFDAVGRLLQTFAPAAEQWRNSTVLGDSACTRCLTVKYRAFRLPIMEIHLTPELQRKLIDVATKTGRQIDDLVQEAVAGFVDELSGVRTMLENRYDEVKSGRMTPVDGEESFARLREKSRSRRGPG